MTSARCDTMASRTATSWSRAASGGAGPQRPPALAPDCALSGRLGRARTPHVAGEGERSDGGLAALGHLPRRWSADESLRFDAVSRLQSRVTTTLIYRGGGCPPRSHVLFQKRRISLNSGFAGAKLTPGS